MGKRKLISGIIIGAVVGGSLALLDKNVRMFSKQCFKEVKDKTANIIKSPSETVGNVRTKLNEVNNMLSKQAGEAIDTLEKIEQTLEKFVDKQ